MFHPKRILVPRATLSKAGGMADLAIEVAGRFEAEVFLLRVDLDSTGGLENYLWSLSADEAANREAAGPTGEPEQQTETSDVHFDRAGSQPAAAAIVDFALQHEIDLIMMAAHTHSVLGRSVFGGVQLEVLRWAPCAVLTGRRERAAELALKPFAHILSPVDFSERSSGAFRVAGEMANRYDASHSALYVQEERIIPRFTEQGLTRASVPSDSDYQEHAGRALREFVAEENTSNREVSCHTARGFIGAQTAILAQEGDVDLIVISAKGLTDDPDVELGHAADRIVRKAPCPVLTVK